jgi:hypothetical protein
MHCLFYNIHRQQLVDSFNELNQADHSRVVAYMKGLWQCQNVRHLCQSPPRLWGPRHQPTKPIGKSGTAHLRESSVNCMKINVKMLR